MTPDAVLVLVRHAEPRDADRCHGARSDPPLSPHGERQAANLALRLRVLGREFGGVTRLLSSPAARAIETCARLAVQLGIDPAVDERWRERDFGAWEGRPWAELWPETPAEVREDLDAYAAWTPPDGETPTAVAARVAAATDHALEGSGTTVVATHAGPIRAALAHALGVDDAVTLRFDVPYGRAVVLTRTEDALGVARVGA